MGEVVARARARRSSRGTTSRPACSSYLDELGFNTVGYGCTTCIGNSGPLADEISAAIAEGDLVVCSVLSGNRNFEARIHPEVKANYLASPPLVVAYALAGRMDIDLASEPIGRTPTATTSTCATSGRARREISETIAASVRGEMFAETYADVFTGDEAWRALPVPEGELFALGAGLDLRAAAAVLRRACPREPAAVERHRRRARASSGSATR